LTFVIRHWFKLSTAQSLNSLKLCVYVKRREVSLMNCACVLSELAPVDSISYEHGRGHGLAGIALLTNSRSRWLSLARTSCFPNCHGDYRPSAPHSESWETHHSA